MAVLDSRYTKKVCSKTWLKCFLESLSSEELNIIKHERSGIIFKFGNRKICLSTERITIPIVNAGKNVFLTTEVSKYKIQCYAKIQWKRQISTQISQVIK